MSTILKFRRATTSGMSSVTGEVAELYVDTDKNTIVVHDGSTAGGTPLATEDYAISYASPQLGGNLDTNGHNIDADTSPLTITAGSDLSLNSTSGDLVLNGFYWPGSDGTEGQVLVTDGNGNLSWADGGIGGSGDYTLDDDETLTFGDDIDLSVRYSDLDNETLFEFKDEAVAFKSIGTQNSGYKLYIDHDYIGIGEGIGGYKLPLTGGVNGQVLVTDNYGQLSWGYATANTSQDLIPDTDSLFSLGSSSKRWYDLYANRINLTNIEPHIHFGSSSGIVKADASGGQFRIWDNQEIMMGVPYNNDRCLTIYEDGIKFGSSNSYTFPLTDGSNGQVLVTDGSGNLSWSTVSSGGTGTTALGDDQSLTFGADNDLTVTYNSVANNVSFDLKVPVKFSQVNTGDKLSINTNDITFHDEVIFDDLVTFNSALAFNNTDMRILSGGFLAANNNIGLSTTGSGSINIDATGSGNIDLDTRISTGDIILNGLTWPGADGTAGQVLTTNGSGTLSWSTGGSGGASGYFYDSGDGSITITEDNGANIEMINGDIFLRSNSASDYVYVDGFRFDGDSGWFNGGILRSNSSKQLYWEALNMNALIDVDMAFTPNDNDILQYNSSTSMWEAVSAPSVTGMSNVVEDITPQLGGDLDGNGFDIHLDNDNSLKVGGDNLSPKGSLLYDSGSDAGVYLTCDTNTVLHLTYGGADGRKMITINNSGMTFPSGLGRHVDVEATSTFSGVATFDARSVHTAGIAINGDQDDDDINFNNGEFIIGKYSVPADGYFLQATASNVRLQSDDDDVILVSGSGAEDQTEIRRGTTTVGSFNANGLTIGDTYTIPYTDGNANEVLATDGSGTVSWTSLTAITGPEGYDYTAGAVTITADSGNDLTLDPGTGDLVLDYSIWPPTEGTSNQVLTTDGNGNLSWTDKGEGGSGSLPSRGEVTGATASIADNATDNIEISAFKAYHLLAIETDVDAWVRIYTTAAARTADATRSEGVDPLPGSGVLAEARIDGVQVMTPPAVGFNFDTPVATTVYVAVTNRSGSTTAVNVTLNIIQIEA